MKEPVPKSAKTQPLSSFLEAYLVSLGKLSHLGLRVSGTRFAQYERLLASAVDGERKGDESHQGTNAFLLTLSESSEVIDIASLPEEYFDAEEKFRLRKISGGPRHVVVGAPDQARDYALEFLAAAALHTQNSFGGFSRLGGDVTFGVARAPVECKRISSVRRLEARLREGRRQVERLVDRGAEPGVILIDVTSPVFSRFGVVRAQSDEELTREVDARLASFMIRFVMNEKNLVAFEIPRIVLVTVAAERGPTGKGTTKVKPWSFHGCIRVK